MKHASKQTQTGFTLVEIMVAVTIGLVMMAGIMQISLANKESARLQRNMGYVQENIRTAMDFLSRDLQQAGFYNRSQAVSPITPTRNFGMPITPFINVAAAATTDTTAAITADGGGANNDQITVTYEVSASTPTDCLGTAPTNANSPAFVSGTGVFVTNHYFIDNQRLMCRGNSGVATALVEGVESLQILYGEDTTNDSERIANHYVTAHEVGDMRNVVSVRLGMRFISREAIRPQADTQSYALLDATAVTPGGRFMRRELTTTISLRNE